MIKLFFLFLIAYTTDNSSRQTSLDPSIENPKRVKFDNQNISMPYPVSRSSGVIPNSLNELSGKGKWLTDDSSDGWRIRKELLDSHNYVRKLESKFTSSINKLVWDFHLEGYSRQWAVKLCTEQNVDYFEHSPDASTGIPNWPFRMSTGENLYTSNEDREPNASFTDVVLKWYAEKDSYNWNTGNSNTSGPVGHWKQLVRPEATIVGCTVVTGCHPYAKDGWKTFVVCHYDYGNVSTHPYVPTIDSQCSKCLLGFDCCESGLCSGYVPANSKGSKEITEIKQIFDDWYKCSIKRTDNCKGTGAKTMINKLANDQFNLEYNECFCDDNFNINDLTNIVDKQLFWFRNSCYNANDDVQDDLIDTESIYLQLDKPYVDNPKIKNKFIVSNKDKKIPLLHKFSDEYLKISKQTIPIYSQKKKSK